jgi:hypothetical protein
MASQQHLILELQLPDINGVQVGERLKHDDDKRYSHHPDDAL